MITSSQDEFERWVEEAIAALSGDIKTALENVVFVVEDAPVDKNLLGLYHGIPKTKRGSGYSMALPDKITIYKRMIENEVNSREALRRLVRRVVWHEIGHHLGFDEYRIRELERKWEKEKKIENRN